MDFPNERYVRIYTTMTPTSTLWGFWGRVLMDQLIKAADEVGVLDLPVELQDDVPAAIASAIGCDEVEWIRQALPKLVERGSVLVFGDRVVLPNYMRAQYCTITRAQRARAWRKRNKAIDRVRSEEWFDSETAAELKLISDSDDEAA